MNYTPPKDGWRTFVIVWSTQSVLVFGSALTLFAVNIWLATVLYPRADQKADLAFALSAYNIAFALPVEFGAPLAGAWADRHDRKRTMMAADLLNGLVSVALVALMATNNLNLWMLLGFAVLGSVLGAFHGAAFDTSYAMLVPEHLLARANGMMQTIWSLSGMLSPALAASLSALPALARQGVIPGIPGA